MGRTISDIDKFHKTRKGKLVFGVSELIIAYLFVSLAIDSGSLWQYTAAILMFIGGLNNLVRSAFLLGMNPNAGNKAKKR